MTSDNVVLVSLSNGEENNDEEAVQNNLREYMKK